MEFRKSKKTDIKEIMTIINKAQDYLKKENIDQWQNGYPDEETIEGDIDNDASYVLLEKERVLGTTALSFDGEETYNIIHEGKWLTLGDYAVIHRIAVDLDVRGKGLAREILSEVEAICREKGILSIKIDTHRKNISMQKFLEKNGFKYCGIIYLSDGNERLAFEKELIYKKGVE